MEIPSQKGERAMASRRRGFGVNASLPPEVIRVAAQTAESLGYDSFWVNDTPDGDGLTSLGEAAAVTETIKLGVGVIPLARRSADSIIDQLQGLNRPIDQERDTGDTVVTRGEAIQVQGLTVPLNRLLLGVGSGPGGPGALDRVRNGVQALQGSLDTNIYISALGPRMSRLAGEIADGVLFNWFTPNHARTAAEWVRAGVQQAGQPMPQLCSYVRVSLGQAGADRLRQEGARYASIPAYGDHFVRMGAEPIATGIAAAEPDQIREGLGSWEETLDEVVVRAITPDDTIDQILAIVEAGAPL